MSYSVDVEKKKCVTPVCRGSYVNMLEPRPLLESEKLAWGMQCLFPKDDPDVAAWRKDLNRLYAKVLIDKFGQEKAATLAPSIKTPLRDGDAPAEADKELEGFWFMNVNNIFRQPHIIGAMGKPLNKEEIARLTVDDLYSGAWYRVMLEYWYYDKAGNKGISASVVAIMKVQEDTNLGSGTSKSEAESAYTEFAGEVSAMTVGGETIASSNGEAEETIASSNGEAEETATQETKPFDFL